MVILVVVVLEVKKGAALKQLCLYREKVTFRGHGEKVLTLFFPFRRWKASCWWEGKILWITQMNSRKFWNRNDRKLQNRYQEEHLFFCLKGPAAELL